LPAKVMCELSIFVQQIKSAARAKNKR